MMCKWWTNDSGIANSMYTKNVNECKHNYQSVNQRVTWIHCLSGVADSSITVSGMEKPKYWWRWCRWRWRGCESGCWWRVYSSHAWRQYVSIPVKGLNDNMFSSLWHSFLHKDAMFQFLFECETIYSIVY